MPPGANTMNSNASPPPADNAGTASPLAEGERAPLVMKKVTAATARDITRHFELLSKSQPLLKAEHTPADFLQILIDHGHYHDAVTFLAQIGRAHV